MGNTTGRFLLIGGDASLYGALKSETAELGHSCDWLESHDPADCSPSLRALSQYLYDGYFLWLDNGGGSLLTECLRLKITRPIVALTGSSDRSVRERILDQGALECLRLEQIATIDFKRALDHARTVKQLEEVRSTRSNYESLIAIISSNFTHLAPEEIDRGITEALAVLGRFAAIDHAFLFLAPENTSSPHLSHEWSPAEDRCASRFIPSPETSAGRWLAQAMLQGETVRILDVGDLPPEAQEFGELLARNGVRSIVITPLFEGRRSVGLLGLAAYRNPRQWTTEVVSLLKIVGETFVNALRRRRDQQALIESEHRFRSLLENLNDGIVYCDREDVILHVNPKACELLGFAAAEMVGENIAKLAVPAESRALLRERTARRLEGIAESYEIKLQRKDGTLLWVEMNASPMRDSEGAIIGSIGSFIDVTERKQVREALRLSEERLRHYFDNSVIGIAISSPTKNFLEVNDYMCHLHGYTREELARITWVELTHPDDRANDLGWFERMARGEIDNYELDKRFIHKDGYIWNARLVVGAVRRPDRSLDYVIALAQDITAERRAQASLRTQAEFYRQLIDSNPNLIFACDYAGRFTLANKAFAEIWGLPVDAIIGKRNRDFVTDPELLNRYDSDNATVIRTAGPLVVPQERITDARTGQERWFQALKTPLLSPDGQTPYILCVASEITERKQAENEANVLQRQLLQSHKMEAIGKLAAGIAHDLNNALAAVVGHLHLLRLNVSPSGKSSLEIALTGCERASSLIQQLLGFSRQGKYNPQVLRIRDIVRTTVEFLAKVIDKDIAVDIQEEDEILSIQGDLAQLQQVITNLIINSVHAIHGPGRITFTFGRREVLQPERFNPRAHPGFFVTLAVSDNGCGIPSEHIDKIFDPFFTTKDEKEGTGLGLSTVYGIMQNHSGWVEVESTPKVGTCFTLIFPQANTQAAALTPEPASPLPLNRSTGGHVLVIDDEPQLVDLARQFLYNVGVAVTGFSDANEAVEWYAREWRSVDLIILDMKMPKMDGGRCFHELRRIDPNARVVIMSGFAQDTAAQELLESGVAHFFEKPLRYPDLVAWIVNELNHLRQVAV
jgi:PAS domain S-box-containing protein